MPALLSHHLIPDLLVLNVLQAGRSKEVTVAAAGCVPAATAGAASIPATMDTTRQQRNLSI